MPIEDRARWKAAVDKTSASAVRGHEGREPSEPPLGSSLPEREVEVDVKSEPQYRRQLPSLLDKVEHAGRWTDALKKIIVGVIFIGGPVGTGICAGFVWAVNKAVDDRFAEQNKRLDPAVLLLTQEEKEKILSAKGKLPPTLTERFAEQSAAIAELNSVLKAANNPQSDLGKTLDRIDSWMQANGKSKNKTPPPVVGPTAKQEGRQ